MGEATLTKRTEEAGPIATPSSSVTAETRVYTPDSPLRDAQGPFQDDRQRSASREDSRFWRLFVRDISAQYRQTAFSAICGRRRRRSSPRSYGCPSVRGMISVRPGPASLTRLRAHGNDVLALLIDAINAAIKAAHDFDRSMRIGSTFRRKRVIASGIGQVLFSFAIKVVVLAVTLAFAGCSGPSATAPRHGVAGAGDSHVGAGPGGAWCPDQKYSTRTSSRL